MKKIKIIVLAVAILLLLASIVAYVILGIYAVATKAVLGLTAAGIIVYAVLYRKDLIEFFKKSNTLTGVYKIAQFLIITGIMVFVYLLSDTLSWKIDLTSSRLYSLSDETLNVLKTVTNDMTILYFKPPALVGPYFDYQENLLKAYAEKNKRIKIRGIDPLANRPTAIDYNVREDAMVVFEYQGNRVYVGFNKILKQDQQSGKVTYLGESAYTSALKTLTLSKPKNVYVLTGHGEGNPADKTSRGFRGIFDKMAEDNIKLKQLNFLQFPGIPEDASLVVIVNPVQAIPAEDLDRLNQYMDNGGSMLVLLEYESHITINDILSRMGVFYYQNMAVEGQDYNPQFGRTTIIAKLLPSEITAPLIKANIPVVMPTASGLFEIPEKERKGKDVIKVTPLLQSSKDSYGETSVAEIKSGKVTQDKKDIKGPLVLGYSSERTKTSIMSAKDGDITNTAESRLVVFGDSDFVNNVFFEKYGDSDLLLNSVNYLLKREGQITIRPKTSEITGFQLTSSEKRFLTIYGFAIFILYLIPGILIVWKRRRMVKM